MRVSLLKLSLTVIACNFTRTAHSTNTFLEGTTELALLLHTTHFLSTCSSKDYTSSFGPTDGEGSFTPNIHHAFNRYHHSDIVCVCVRACM